MSCLFNSIFCPPLSIISAFSIFSNLSKFHLYGYVVDFLYIALRNQSTIFNTTQINLIIDFLKLIQNFNQEISVETQKRITSTIQLCL